MGVYTYFTGTSMKIICSELKSELLSELLDARMKHTEWVTQVVNEKSLSVEESPNHCRFGKWIIDVKDILADLDEYHQLMEPHINLHHAYTQFKENSRQETFKDEIKRFSSQLIDRIDALEKTLNQSNV